MKGLVKKTIILSATLFLTALLFIFTLVSFAAPLTMAKFYDNIGLKNFALICYDEAYKNNEDVYVQSFAFDKAVKQKNYMLIKKYGDKLINNADLPAFLTETNQFYYEQYAAVPQVISEDEYVKIYNELNYIIKNFITAKVKTARRAEAKQTALYLLNQSNANADIIFAIMPLADAKIKFSKDEKDFLAQRYNNLEDALQTSEVAADPLKQKIIKYRLCEMAAALYKITNKQEWSIKAAGWIA